MLPNFNMSLSSKTWLHTMKGISTDTHMPLWVRTTTPDLPGSHLVKGVHGQQNHPGNIQRLDDLAGHGGFAWGTATTESCSQTRQDETNTKQAHDSFNHRISQWLLTHHTDSISTERKHTSFIVNPPKAKDSLSHQQSDGQLPNYCLSRAPPHTPPLCQYKLSPLGQ